MIQLIRFWDRMRAQEHVFENNDVVISITDPNALEAPITGAKDVHRSQFYDVKEIIDVHGHIMFPITEELAKAIQAKVEEWHLSPERLRLTVHCEAGASRSAAIALYVYMYTLGNFPTISSAMFASSTVLGMMEKVSGQPCLTALELSHEAASLI